MSALAHLFVRIGHSNALAAAATLAIGILTARWLGPDGRGAYALFVTTAGVAGTIGQAGLYQSNIYYISKKDISPATALGGLFLLVLLNLFILSIAAWFIFPHLDVGPIVTTRAGLNAALDLACLCLVVQEGLGGIVMAMKQYSIYTDQLVFDQMLILFFTLALYLMSRSADAAIWLRVGGSICAITIMLCRVRKLDVGISFNPGAFLHQISFGSRNVAQNLIGLLNYRVYLYFLAADPTATGYFSIALLFCELVRFVPNAAGTALLPFLAGGSHVDNGKLAAKSCRHLLAFSVIVAAALALSRKYIIQITFGAAFLPIVQPALIMLLGALTGTIYQVFTRYFTSIGRQSVSVACGAVGLAVGSIASVLLIPAYGLEGAAIAYLAGSLATAITIAYGFHRVSAEHPSEFLLMKRSDLVLWADALRRTRTTS